MINWRNDSSDRSSSSDHIPSSNSPSSTSGADSWQSPSASANSTGTPPIDESARAQQATAQWGNQNSANESSPHAAQSSSPGWATPVVQESPSKPKRGIGALSIAALMLASAAVGGGAAALVVNNSSASNSLTSSSSSENALSQPGQQRSAPSPAGSTEAVAQQVLPSVVSIQISSSGGVAAGSGSILSSDGLVLTNNHVAASASQPGARMEVALNDGSRHPAKVIAGDAATDIAVIQIENVKGLRPISLGASSDVKVGQEVIAVGSPLGLSSTVTQGIVSALNRPVSAAQENGEQSVIDAIQTDAAINPGNSGGALVDMEGHLIGVPSVIASLGGGNQQSGSIGLGFAIPIDQARRIAEDLIENGHARMPVIGAMIDTRSQGSGAAIARVNPGSPAEQAGIKDGDVITKVENRPLDSGVALIASIRSHKVGDTVEMTVTDGRGGKERTVNVTLAEAPE